jgi:hypothetical protein
MPDPSERRRFPRLDISEEARVYDENGRELGKVAQVSGSGMNIAISSPEIPRSLPSGRQLRVTVVEPGSRTTNVLDVVVRQLDGDRLGMEFIRIIPDKA